MCIFNFQIESENHKANFDVCNIVDWEKFNFAILEPRINTTMSSGACSTQVKSHMTLGVNSTTFSVSYVTVDVTNIL